jgi:prolyl-tRNA editing enzyme YbaK/EbsC (Cys-tRNA(Pro) deacylase)
VRSCSDVHNLLLQEGVPHEIVHLSVSSRTARRAAEALGVSVDEVVKSLVFLVDERPFLVLVPGEATVDTAALLREFGGEQVALARGEEVLRITGYRPGAVPPCGLDSSLTAVADPGVFAPEVVYCGGGTTTTMLKIRSADLRALLEPRMAPIAKRR